MASKKDKKESKALAIREGMLGKLPNIKKENGFAVQGLKNKKGISYQIQSRIGKSVILVLVIIALLATFMVNNIVSDANDTELALESQVVSYQLAEFLAPFQTMTEQLAVNTELQLLMSTLSLAKNTAKHSGYPDTLANIQHIQTLDTDLIFSVSNV